METTKDVESIAGLEVQQSEGNSSPCNTAGANFVVQPTADLQGGDNATPATDIVNEGNPQTRLTLGERMTRVTLFRRRASKKLKPAVVNPQVPFYKLFMFADWWDYLLIVLGTIGACVHGVSVPIFFLFFGALIDAFGANYANPHKMGQEVSKVTHMYKSPTPLLHAFISEKVGAI
ncbi:hypothetical protein Mapa_008573 [Marchantia paleacea]|nr:hypothetical protein Mapa_008573 [Marchantia paleacea]